MAVTGGYDRDEAILLMTLCGLTYIDAQPHPFESIPAQEARMLKDINTALAASPHADWQVQWGPAIDDERANMMFVAGKKDLSQCAVCIRGTDPAFIIDWVQDLRVLDLVDFPYTSAPGVQIAAGTAGGLDELVQLVGTTATGDQDLLTFLQQVTPGTLFVTGHSLGGCLASVVAPWLASELGSADSIKVYTFAAPSAGNGNFATFYNGLFADAAGKSTAFRLYNTLDVVPNAWSSLLTIKTYYAPNPGCPDNFKLIIDATILGVGTRYSQVGNKADGSAIPLLGQVVAVPASAFPVDLLGDVQFINELNYQHGTGTYLSLL